MARLQAAPGVLFFLSLSTVRSRKMGSKKIGVSWNNVCLVCHPDKNEKSACDEVKNILIDLFTRRNQIAHQSDRSHKNAAQNSISKEYVEGKLEEIKNFVNAIYNIALKTSIQA